MQAGLNAETITAAATVATVTGGVIALCGRLAARWVNRTIRIAHADLLVQLDARFVPLNLCEERCARREALEQLARGRHLPVLKLQGEELT